MKKLLVTIIVGTSILFASCTPKADPLPYLPKKQINEFFVEHDIQLDTTSVSIPVGE
ncbi:hypothetical protein KMW28_25825 [Flammeovirga yaeyamensis]|uniref:Uncharacterized protein n=1 Tax=Flammeovirga yaeyamensis TaxID=367791 RepID=A0AAX1ND24_9BACT|nr:hypothetical protein [Flammeovirga yaeyamensis]MBB3699281.1 hypothetical protein [Flammeovirga yaeyamensis]NMF35456.1 hypothetical protein [Flammeovirga yaeyamensis]QWG04316.1 hypothetical protein KMW28_25825 [Flammeovirga yaeyamensis]